MTHFMSNRQLAFYCDIYTKTENELASQPYRYVLTDYDRHSILINLTPSLVASKCNLVSSELLSAPAAVYNKDRMMFMNRTSHHN